MFCTRIGVRRSFSVWVLHRTRASSRRSSESSRCVEHVVDSHRFVLFSPAARLQEERVLHEAKLAKMEAEMKMVFQQKVQEKEAKLKQSEEELYARHKEMKDALDKQRTDLEEKKRKIESGRPLTPEKNSVSARTRPRSSHPAQRFCCRPERREASFVNDPVPENIAFAPRGF